MHLQKKGIAFVMTNHSTLQANTSQRVVLLLGFMGGTFSQLQRKYRKTAEKHNLQVAAITLPFACIMNPGKLKRDFENAMQWFDKLRILERSDTLVVCSGGGAILKQQLDRWYVNNPNKNRQINRILWENSPGDFSFDEIYRGFVKILPGASESSFVSDRFVKPIIKFFYNKRTDLGSTAIQNSLQRPAFATPTVAHYCIANRADEVIDYNMICHWVDRMTRQGNTVHMETFENLGHLKAHKDFERYDQVWARLLSYS